MTRLPKHPTPPGSVLLEDFLNPLNVSQRAFARHVGISGHHVNAIVHGRRAITAETAWLFAAAFGNSPQFWMNLQTTFDLVHHKAERRVQKLSVAV